jgi:SET domain-containing protein
MLKKQSKILKQESKKVSKVSKSLLKKVGVTQKKKAKTEALPTHQFKNVKVKRGLSGLGLFAGENIKKGEIIIEYIGDILTKEEADKINTNQYLFEVSRNRTIDGRSRGNIARYANHSCEGSENAESDVKKGRVFIKAIKNIKEGEEITYDYGEEFFDEYIKPYGCNCKAPVHTGGHTK